MHLVSTSACWFLSFSILFLFSSIWMRRKMHEWWCVSSLFWCKKTFLPFFTSFCFFGLSFLSFFLASLEKEAFLLHSVRSVCILSPLPFLLFARRRRERFTFWKKKKKKKNKALSIVAFVWLVKQRCSFWKRERRRKRSFRENSIEISKIKSSLESSSSSSWGNKRTISDRTKSTGYSKTSR